MIETRLLHYFLAIAEEQSITKAAEYLHITQPTLSKQMMDLEATLGKQLLIRGKKKVTLTEEGMYLRDRAREILSLMEKTESSFRESEQIIAGDIYIGCGEYHSIYPVIQLIQRIQEKYSDIHFHIFSGNADAIIERLDKGLIDIGILLEPEISPRYEYQKLDFWETWGVLMRKDAPLASQSSVSFRDLTGLPLIMPNQSSNNRRLHNYFSDAGVEPFTVATYNLIYNAALMVEAGMGYALGIDDLVVTDENHPLNFLPFSPVLNSQIYMFHKKYQVFSKAAKLFLNQVRENFSAATSLSGTDSV